MGACGSRAAKETVVDVADVALEKVPERRSAEEPTPEELEDAYEQALEAIEAGDATALANLLKSHAVPARMLVRLAGGEQDDTPLHAAALGEPALAAPADAALEKLAALAAADGLPPTRVRVASASPACRERSFGAGADSYYETLLKRWLQGGGTAAPHYAQNAAAPTAVCARARVTSAITPRRST